MPKNTQTLFPEQPTISERDAKRLQPHLSGWNRLSEMLVLDTITLDDLKRLVVLEARSDAPRKAVVRKLVARVLSRERSRIMAEVFK